jgi:hypothetical protein
MLPPPPPTTETQYAHSSGRVQTSKQRENIGVQRRKFTLELDQASFKICDYTLEQTNIETENHKHRQNLRVL